MNLNISRHEDKIYYHRIFEKDTFKIDKIDDIDNTVVFDIGAHIGLFSLKIANKFDCIIHAYEPEEINYDIFNKNIDTNKFNKIVLHNKAVWYNVDNMKLYLDDDIDSFDSHNLYKGDNYIEVETIRPEDIFKHSIDLSIGYLKSNCEGGELYILRYLLNQGDTIIQKIQNCSIEVHPSLLPESTHDELICLLKEFQNRFQGDMLEYRLATYKSNKDLLDKFKNRLIFGWVKI